MREKLAPVWLLAERELKDQFRDWRIIFPLLILTFLFPPLMNSFAGQTVGFMNRYGGNLILDRLVPFSILIIGFFPVTVSLVVALESFVGEKERGTIEPLLGTPILDWQLYLGKLLVGVFFPLVASYSAIAFYIMMISKQDLNLPPQAQIVQLLVLTLAHALLMVSGAIVISTQSTSVKAANLLASFIVIPVALLIQGESVLLFWGDGDVLWMAVVAVLILAAVLVRVGIAHFQREYLLGREIDTFNVKWIGQTFWFAFRGDADSLWAWYQVQIGGVLRRLRLSLLLVTFITVLGGVVSYQWMSSALPEYVSEFTQEEVDETVKRFSAVGGLSPDAAEVTFGFVFSNNLRVVLLMFGFGLFSFGILGQLVFLVNVGFIGGVLSVLNYFDFPVVSLFIAGVLPHGILEIPAVMLASAAVLHFGTVLVTPDPARTMGEVLIYTMADWFKVFLGLVLPLLLVAALIEAYITPQILLGVM